MVKHSIVCCCVLAMGTVAQAGAVLELVAAPSANPFNPAGYYDPSETVTVEFYLSQSPGEDHLVRLLKLNFDNTDPALVLGTHRWEFGSVGHYLDADRDSGPVGVAAAYYYEVPTDLGPNPDAQLLLPGDGSAVRVATVDVTMPGASGDFIFSALNADESNPDAKGALAFGFGCQPASACDNGRHADATHPITFLRAGGAGLAGLPVVFHVIDQALTASNPADQQSLWRSQKNIVRLTFATDIAANVGQISLAENLQIRELLPDGAFGPNLSAGFDFVVEDDGLGNPRVLKVQDTGGSMSHRSWYGIQNIGGWSATAPFEVQHVLQVGDADGNKLVISLDVGAVNAGIPCFVDCGDDNRLDIDGDGRVISLDVGVVNRHIGSFTVSKPSGH